MLDLGGLEGVVSELERVVPLLLKSSLVNDSVGDTGGESGPPNNLQERVGTERREEGKKERKEREESALW